jgi:hypothetical protein
MKAICKLTGSNGDTLLVVPATAKMERRSAWTAKLAPMEALVCMIVP